MREPTAVRGSVVAPPKGRRGGWKPYLLLLPIFLFAAGFVYYPFARTFLYAFTQVNFRGEAGVFVGFEHFQYLFGNETFQAALRNTLWLTLFFVPLNLMISLGLALLAARRRRGGALYEMLFTMPMAVSMPAASMIFKVLLNPTVGVVNHWLRINIGWFQDAKYALWGILLLCLWMGISFDFLLLLSAVRNVPEDLTEAAMLDGAGYFTRLLRVQLPVISPTMLYVVCSNVVLVMMTSGPVLIITEGGPARSTTTLIYYMYTSGYKSANYSLAAAVSLITFALTFGMVLGSMYLERRGVHYD